MKSKKKPQKFSKEKIFRVKNEHENNTNIYFSFKKLNVKLGVSCDFERLKCKL